MLWYERLGTNLEEGCLFGLQLLTKVGGFPSFKNIFMGFIIPALYSKIFIKWWPSAGTHHFLNQILHWNDGNRLNQIQQPQFIRDETVSQEWNIAEVTVRPLSTENWNAIQTLDIVGCLLAIVVHILNAMKTLKMSDYYSLKYIHHICKQYPRSPSHTQGYWQQVDLPENKQITLKKNLL